MNKQENLNSDGKTVNASAGMTRILELTDRHFKADIIFFNAPESKNKLELMNKLEWMGR